MILFNELRRFDLNSPASTLGPPHRRPVFVIAVTEGRGYVPIVLRTHDNICNASP